MIDWSTARAARRKQLWWKRLARQAAGAVLH
jgi:hypothetical protein